MDTKKFTQDDDEILNKFSLNTDCQKLLVQIIRNADNVPGYDYVIRCLFAHNKKKIHILQKGCCKPSESSLRAI